MKYDQKITRGGVTVYKYYDEKERMQIEERVCDEFPQMSKLINEIALKRDFNKQEIQKLDIDNLNSYIYRGFRDILKKLDL